MRPRVSIKGVFVDRLDLRLVEERIAGFVATEEPHQVVTVNLDFISQSLRDPSFRQLINSSALAVPDGMPLIWAAKVHGTTLPQRITGNDLMQVCCRLAQRDGRGIFLLGAAPGVAAQAGHVLRSRYPKIRIAGTYSPPFGDFTSEEDDKIINLVRDSAATYLFVAFGCPKQDVWIKRNLARLDVPVCIGVGAAFDFLVGRVKRAPVWMQNLGFEWLFRLGQEPRRLARRYLIDDLPVFIQLLNDRPVLLAALEGSASTRETNIHRFPSERLSARPMRKVKSR